MNILTNSVMYFLSFKPYVMLPVIIFILAMVFRIEIKMAIKSCLTIGIGFVGIFMVFDYFVTIISPAVEALIKRANLNFNVLDAGWPPLAASAWSFKLAPILVVIFIIVNLVMLVTKLTKVVDIDIWNYWHFIITGAAVYEITGSALLCIITAVITCIAVIKMAEWSAPMVNKFAGLKGICLPTLSAVLYFPLGVLGNELIEKIPVLNKIDANPEKMQKKLGLLGEPMIIGFIMGLALGFGGGYDIKGITDLAVGFAAVIYILPKMCGILGSALVPISEGMKEFITKHFPDMGETYIGLDVAVILGTPSITVTALLLMPVSLILAFILPGVKFIPLGDLTFLLASVSLVCVATKGNVFRSFLIGLPIVVASLYTATAMANVYTNLATTVNYKITGYNGVFTSFLDGGNLFRTWIENVFSGNLAAILVTPIILVILFSTWKIIHNEQ